MNNYQCVFQGIFIAVSSRSMQDYSDTELWARAIQIGDRVALAKAITLIEGTREDQLLQSAELLSRCSLNKGLSKRIGITGVPGVGKSTFIDSFGSLLTKAGKRVAVLAVDPSSDVSRGSILGDKTRMEKLGSDPNAFIRPTPSAGSLGGVARKTRETITLCESAGYDTILIETVGVGQSETAVHSMVDMFVLLVLATAGDELQGIKRGIMEMADLVVINKDDGENSSYTKLAKASYHQALHMFPAKESGWTVPVVSCSALNNTGLDMVESELEKFFRHVTVNGFLESNRQNQNSYWLQAAIEEELKTQLFADESVKAQLKSMEQEVSKGNLSPFVAAKKLIFSWRQSN